MQKMLFNFYEIDPRRKPEASGKIWDETKQYQLGNFLKSTNIFKTIIWVTDIWVT